ncbi:hypothetical protein GW884_00625 [Candidatus Falkowbacteria bacterium]|nr:hypothetical protein [Candidatus Falkowbacteria bacterium]
MSLSLSPIPKGPSLGHISWMSKKIPAFRVEAFLPYLKKQFSTGWMVNSNIFIL